jgi:hypothetical protein
VSKRIQFIYSFISPSVYLVRALRDGWIHRVPRFAGDECLAGPLESVTTCSDHRSYEPHEPNHVDQRAPGFRHSSRALQAAGPAPRYMLAVFKSNMEGLYIILTHCRHQNMWSLQRCIAHRREVPDATLFRRNRRCSRNPLPGTRVNVYLFICCTLPSSATLC